MDHTARCGTAKTAHNLGRDAEAARGDKRIVNFNSAPLEEALHTIDGQLNRGGGHGS